MKSKLKGYCLAGLAVAIILGFTAFKGIYSSNTPQEEAKWFMFISPLNAEDPDYEVALTDPESYQLIDDNLKPTCEGKNEKICAIMVKEVNKLPSLSELTDLKQDMLNVNSNNDQILRKPKDN